MLLLLGCLMDMSPLILILTPILLPVVKLLGVDPVHFGMIMMVNLGMGLITPPVGTVLFVGSAVSGAEDRRRGACDEALLHRALRGADDGDLPSVAEPVAAAGDGAVEPGVVTMADFTPSARLPDPRIEVFDERFLALRLLSGTVEQPGHRLLLGRRPGVVRRRALPAFVRHPQQPHPALGRWLGRASVFPPNPATTPTAWHATARAGC
jgi:hypothetical protein